MDFFFIILPFIFAAIVPDIDEIAAQAETMFAGRYSSIYVSLFYE